jgi:cytidine deaminase
MNTVSPEYKKLFEKAQEAAKNSYCPYSKFSVGAALLTKDGSIFTGCNVENASYGGAICAERTAFVKAVSEGHREFKAIAVCCSQDTDCYPCGICRQFMCEFGTDLELILQSKGGLLVLTNLETILPHSFNSQSFEH